MLIILGLIIGSIASSTQMELEKVFTPRIFFVFILPPIVLEAGYLMPKDAFINNIGTILTYAICGTLFCAFSTGIALWQRMGNSKSSLNYVMIITLLTLHPLLAGMAGRMDGRRYNRAFTCRMSFIWSYNISC